MFDSFQKGVAMFSVILADGATGFTGRRDQCQRYAEIRNEHAVAHLERGRPSHRSRHATVPTVGPPQKRRKGLAG